MKRNALFFRSDWTPRDLIRLLLFRRDRRPRKVFRRAVFKKNGTIRPEFQNWMTFGKVSTPQPSYPQADRRQDIAPQPSEPKADRHPHIEILDQLLPLSRQAEAWKRDAASETHLTAEDVLALLERVSGNWLVLAASHDNYTEIPGGVQVCLLREEKLVRDAGGHYLNIHPLQPLPCLADEDEAEDTSVVLVLDGKVSGPCRMSVLVDVMGRMSEAGTKLSLSIHSLLGHKPEQLAQLGQCIRSQDIVLWLHDYFTICPGVRLQRNDLAFCGAPDVTSNACGICAYGAERVRHLQRMKSFFAEMSPTLLSPSSFTQDLWLARTAFRTRKILTVPHVALSWHERDEPLNRNDARRIRVGFLGTPVRHKGWPLFERLARDPKFAEKFEFVAFNASETQSGSKRIDVKITPDNPDAMARAVAAEEIDLVLHWPDWPETFGLTAYEALEAGAWLVTNPGSGNIASTVETLGRGVILPDEDALKEFFSGGAAAELAEKARAERAAFTVTATKSRLSLSVLEGS